MPHVMIVEDDPAIRNGLCELLELEGFRVSRAENGRVSLSQLEAGVRPDVIVLDLLMPVMDGWTFLHQLRAGDQSAIPVVVVTSLSGPAERDRITRAGASDVFDKTGQLDLVLDRIRAYCDV